jgi:hypothetical protein
MNCVACASLWRSSGRRHDRVIPPRPSDTVGDVG